MIRFELIDIINTSIKIFFWYVNIFKIYFHQLWDGSGLQLPPDVPGGYGVPDAAPRLHEVPPEVLHRDGPRGDPQTAQGIPVQR